MPFWFDCLVLTFQSCGIEQWNHTTGMKKEEQCIMGRRELGTFHCIALLLGYAVSWYKMGTIIERILFHQNIVGKINHDRSGWHVQETERNSVQLRHQDSGERVRGEARRTGHGKGVGHCSHGNGKPLKGLSRQMQVIYAQLSSYTSSIAKATNLPSHQRLLRGKRYWAPTAMDAKDRNRASTLRNNIPL